MSLQGYNFYNYSNGFKNNEFHHIVLSISGTSHSLYLDGSMVSQIVSSGNMFDSYQQITNTVIGAQPRLTQAFRGIIGDVRVYNYAIPSTKVSNLYRDRNLVVYYPFDTTANDFAPNYATLQYDASMIGGATTNSSSGVNALSLTNTNSKANQYVVGSPPSWMLNKTNGLTIGCWVNVAGISDRVQRIFDIPWEVSTQGLVIDISGTNMLYSRWNRPLELVDKVTNILAVYPYVSGTGLGSIWLDASGSTDITFSSSNIINQWKDKQSPSLLFTKYNSSGTAEITYNSSSPSYVNFPKTAYFVSNVSTTRVNLFATYQTLVFVASFPDIGTTNYSYLFTTLNRDPGGIDFFVRYKGSPDFKLALYLYHHASPGYGNDYLFTTLTSNTKYLFSISLNNTFTGSYSNASNNNITSVRINGNAPTSIITNKPADNTTGYTSSGSSNGMAIGMLLSGTSQFATSNYDRYVPYEPTAGFNLYEMIRVNSNSANLGIADVITIERYLNTKWNLGYAI